MRIKRISECWELRTKTQWFLYVYGSPCYFHFDTWREAVEKMDFILRTRKFA